MYIFMTSVNITQARKAHILMYRKFSHQNAIKEKKKMVLMVNAVYDRNILINSNTFIIVLGFCNGREIELVIIDVKNSPSFPSGEIKGAGCWKNY